MRSSGMQGKSQVLIETLDIDLTFVRSITNHFLALNDPLAGRMLIAKAKAELLMYTKSPLQPAPKEVTVMKMVLLSFGSDQPGAIKVHSLSNAET